MSSGRLEAHYAHSHAHDHVAGGHDEVHALEANLYAAQRNALLTGISLFLLVYVPV